MSHQSTAAPTISPLDYRSHTIKPLAAAVGILCDLDVVKQCRTSQSVELNAGARERLSNDQNLWMVLGGVT